MDLNNERRFQINLKQDRKHIGVNVLKEDDLIK